MSEFFDRLTDVMEKQYRFYQPYQTLCEMEGVGWSDIKAMIKLGELYAIPTIPADWFKRNKGKGLFKKLADLQQEGQWLVSSSTSGDSSYTWRTTADIQAITDSFMRAYQRTPACKALAFSPDTNFLRKVGQRFTIDDRPVMFYATVPSSTADDFFVDMDCLVRLNTLRTVWTMIRTRGKGRPVLNLQKERLIRTIEAAEQNGSRLVFAASILMLYPTLKELPQAYNLGKNAYFVTGAGGWDGKKGTMQGETIDKAQFVADMCRKFNIPQSAVSTNFWDIYGTTENGKAQAGPYSSEYNDYLFEATADVKLYVINPVSGRPALTGEQGFPRFISPYGVEGFAGACIQQNDIVTVVSQFDDGSTKQFTHISRASDGEGSAGGVGCAYELVEGVQA